MPVYCDRFKNAFRTKRGMKAVDVKLKKLEVCKMDFRNGLAEVRLIVNDGKDKALVRSVKLDDVIEQAQELFAEVRKKMKVVHQNQDIAEDILGGFVIIRFKDDEEVCVERIAKFLNNLRERVRSAQNGRMSYYEAEQKCRLDQLVF